MPTTTRLLDGPVSVVAYRCEAALADPPCEEQHGAWSLSYVRQGSFGCRTRGRAYELIPGSLLAGRPGDEYLCTHDHSACGDACLAFFFAPEVADEIGRRSAVWQSGGVPPLAELVVLGELAQHSATGGNDLGLAEVGLAEVGLALASRFVGALAGRKREPLAPTPTDRRRAVASAMWIAAHAAEPIDLATLAARSGQSPFHYLRVFGAVLGVTPHQYLIRCRLREAAQLLADEDRSITDVALDAGFADLSNFVRSFGRAAGISPRGYRRAARGDRKIFQERLAGLA